MKRGAAWCLVAVAFAAQADDRARIATEKRAVEARHAEAQARCAERFAVNACLDDARAQRRQALAALRSQELALDEAERKRRAADRMQAIERKRAEAAALPASELGAGPVLRAPRVAGPQPVPPAASRPQALRAAEEAEAARRAAAAERVREDAARDRERIEQRQAERQQQGRTSQPLPVPPEAAASGARR